VAQAVPENGISQIAPSFSYIPDRISLSHGAVPQTRQLRKDEPHPVGALESAGQLLNDMTIDFSLGIYEANEIRLCHG
jgi:hypothetical protein